MLLIYNFILTSVFIIGFPIWGLIVLKKKYRSGILRKFCLYSDPLIKDRLIQVHAVSVGEINAAISFIEKLKEKFPSHKILVTCSTHTGYKNAHSKIKGCIIEYMPVDVYWNVVRFFKFYPVEMVFIFETELWPNFIHIAHKSKMPVYIVNGRISDRSFPRYLKFKKFLRYNLKKISLVFCQSTIDSKRFAQIGMREDKIIISGNMKFDSAVASCRKELASEKSFNINKKDSDLVFLAGSTQETENLVCTRIFLDILKEFPYARFILAPRKPDTIGETVAFLESKNIEFSRLSGIKDMDFKGQILLVDTIGVLFGLYRFADVVFIGKSLFPGGGGQNPIEPAVWGKPILMGESFENFRDVVEKMIEENAIKIVMNSSDLRENIRQLLGSADKRAELSSNSREFVVSKASVCDFILKQL